MTKDDKRWQKTTKDNVRWWSINDRGRQGMIGDNGRWWHKTMKYNEIQWNTMKYDKIQWNMTKDDKRWWKMTKDDLERWPGKMTGDDRRQRDIRLLCYRHNITRLELPNMQYYLPGCLYCMHVHAFPVTMKPPPALPHYYSEWNIYWST